MNVNKNLQVQIFAKLQKKTQIVIINIIVLKMDTDIVIIIKKNKVVQMKAVVLIVKVVHQKKEIDIEKIKNII